MTETTTDLCNLESKALLSVDEALTQIETRITQVNEVEVLELQCALGRNLAETVHSPVNIPFDRNAAMDGFAFASQDIVSKPFTLTQVGISRAGCPFEGQLQAGQCIRIFTGAVVPKAADSVIMQEQVQIDGLDIVFPANTRAMQNIRERGEDVAESAVLCSKSRKLSAIDLGLLAASGIKSLKVYRKIKIAVFSTGDELIPIGQPLSCGKIYDSNRYLLSALLKDCCFELTDAGVIADNKKSLEDKFVETAKYADVIITTGGASVGDADYIKEVLETSGKLEFWKIAIKPGKPLTFGKINDCYFFGLPGNPVSALVGFEQFVAPALKKLGGFLFVRPFRLKASCNSELKKSPGRTEFQRGVLGQNDNGDFFVYSAGQQGSHIQTTSSIANCFIVLPPECQGVAIGDSVWVEPFSLFI